MKTAFHRKPHFFLDLEAARSDRAPASKAYENPSDAAMLASMKDGAILINVSRGKPADPTNPLLARPQAPITPHIAGATDVMLDGTLDYSARVSDDLTVGQKPHSVLDAPANPRRKLS